jgi:tRNA pseudouridine55 synthase
MDGILLFNKPILWTSHDAVDFIRRRLGQKAVGHAGTLDPLATGLLVMLLGKATKLSQELSASDKDYAGTLTLGVRTDTQDLEGKIVSFGDWEKVQKSEIENLFLAMSGAQLQAPPQFSAVKKKGKSLYRWAREGVTVENEAREINVKRFILTGLSLPDVYFSLGCSKGTYVRTLCDDAGQRLGCGAVLSALVRTRSGPFRLTAALTQEDIQRFSLTEIEKRLVKPPHENLPRFQR